MFIANFVVMVLQIERDMSLCNSWLVAKRRCNEHSHTIRLCTLNVAKFPPFASSFTPQCVKYYFKQTVRSTSADYQ